MPIEAIEGLDTVGKRIRHARTERGLTQPQLAKDARIKQPSLSELETGETKEISGPTLISLAKALKVRAEWLMEGELPIEAENRAEQQAATYIVSSYAVELARTYDALPPGCQDHLRNQVDLLKRVPPTDEDLRRAADHNGEYKNGKLTLRERPEGEKDVR